MKRKIGIKKVQSAFSHAIIRRDGRCMICDYEPCSGNLECSHYFTKGSSPSLMFYPHNAYAQCNRHHYNHHNKKEFAKVYSDWMQENKSAELEKMKSMRFCNIHYDNFLKAKIVELCNADKLDELAKLIEGELQ